MSQQVIEAVYKKGVLKPLTKVNFKEHQKIRLTLSPSESAVLSTKGIFKINPKIAQKIAEDDSLLNGM